MSLCAWGGVNMPRTSRKRVQQESISGIFKADEPSPSIHPRREVTASRGTRYYTAVLHRLFFQAFLYEFCKHIYIAVDSTEHISLIYICIVRRV